MIKCAYFLLALVFSCYLYSNADDAEQQKKTKWPTQYLYPADYDDVVPLPFVTLRGEIIQHTFPGVPNYESIEDGDTPETRWVLVIPEPEIQRLQQLNYIPHDIYDSEQRGWVQLMYTGEEKDFLPFLHKQVLVDGYLGTLAFHIHTPIAIEATKIYDDEQKMD
jgi:hypothetical protein